jgi:hypothetical protein
VGEVERTLSCLLLQVHLQNPELKRAPDLRKERAEGVAGEKLSNSWTRLQSKSEILLTIAVLAIALTPVTHAQTKFNTPHMFQSDEGPSFPAHQFLLSGTSAPVSFGDPSGLYQDFDAENTFYKKSFDNFDDAGCIATLPYSAFGSDPKRSTCPSGSSIFISYAQG